VRVQSDPAGYAGSAGYAGNDVRLEYRDADEGGAGRAADQGGADAVSLPCGRTIEGCGVMARDAARERKNHLHVRSGGVAASGLGGFRFVARDNGLLVRL
jgi:hypothetical protein